MDLIKNFSDFVKTKIMGNLPAIEKNLLAAAYPTLEQTQSMAGTGEALRSIHDCIDNVIEKFVKEIEPENLNLENFITFLKQEISVTATNIRSLSYKNQGLHQGLMSVSDSLDALKNEHEDLLNNSTPPKPENLEPLKLEDESTTNLNS